MSGGDPREALTWPLFALMDQAVDEGWPEKQVAEAVQELTLAWRRWRRETRATEAHIAAARRRACQ